MLTCIIVGIASLLAALIAVSKAFGFHTPARVDYDAIQWPVGRSGYVQPRIVPGTTGSYVSDNPLLNRPSNPDLDITYKKYGYTTREAADALTHLVGSYPTVFEYEASQQPVHHDYEEPMSFYAENQ